MESKMNCNSIQYFYLYLVVRSNPASVNGVVTRVGKRDSVWVCVSVGLDGIGQDMLRVMSLSYTCQGEYRTSTRHKGKESRIIKGIRIT